MDYERWAPRYVAVTDDLHYSREGDLAAALRLSTLVAAREGPIAQDGALSALLGQQPVYVCAAGPTLEEELGDFWLDGTVVAADGATARLLKRGTLPEVVVTDLDGDTDAILAASRKGSIVIVHAHADNLPLVEKFVPLIEGPLVPSVQCAPPPGTRNFGGLTDGDRAVFLADHFGASPIVLSGFDFGDEAQHPLPKDRQRKFIWGAMLIASLDNAGVMFLNEYAATRGQAEGGRGAAGLGPPSL